MSRAVELWEWEMFVGTNLPMPPDVTREQLWAAVDAINALELQDEGVKGLDWCGKSLKRLHAREKELEKALDPAYPEIAKDLGHVRESIRITHEMIETYRSWIV